MKDYNTIIDVELSESPGLDHDYWCDIYIESACWPDGTYLTEEELEAVPDDIIYEYIINFRAV